MIPPNTDSPLHLTRSADSARQSGVRLISLWEPWATLMALGLKTIETRSWATSYRGWLAIQASKGGLSKAEFLSTVEDTPGMFAALSTVPRFCEWFNRRGTGMRLSDVLPLGKIVAVVNLVECVPVVTSGKGLCLKFANAEAVKQTESYFGDYSYGRYGWMTSKLVRLPDPIPFTAKQGLCLVDAATVESIREQWRAAMPICEKRGDDTDASKGLSEGGQ